MTTLSNTQELPNGPVAAALLAGGAGAAMLGLATTLAEASAGVKNLLVWFNPVGPLSGKTGVAVITFFASWIVMHLIFRGKNVNFARATAVALTLLFIGLMGTFPPFFELFVKE